LSLALVLAAMAWLSRLVIKLDSEGKAALRQAAFEENVRLALWRMDSALAGLISLENARPYDSYPSLIRKPPETAAAVPTGDLSAASLSQVLLYFQFEPDGRLVFPIDAKKQSAHLDPLRRKVTKSALLESIQYTEEIQMVQMHTLPEEQSENTDSAIPTAPEPLQSLLLNDQSSTAPQPAENPAPQLQSRIKKGVQQSMNINEQKIRQDVINQNLRTNALSQSYQSQAKPESIPEPEPEHRIKSLLQDTNLELMHPVWLDEDLFLVRRLSIGKQEYVQGCWLDWPAIRGMLLKLVDDLLPRANLAPLKHPPTEEQTRLLASIPVQLIPGPIPVEPQDGWSVLDISLVIAWIGVLSATLAVGMVLRQTIELDQRRGAFVSAVTHELRTPLTTFRMYTEMLNEEMIPEGEKRKQYLGTLHSEAERLNHLVENVLAYAQLENSGGGTKPIEILSLGELKERIAPRLGERAAQSGMELKLEIDNQALVASVRADLSAVERILCNLVDNAGKYAGKEQDSHVLFSIRLKNSMAALSIRDYGPGIPSSMHKKLFVPFSKSASEAANSARGIGLGLAISRRLARQMHGNLFLDHTVSDGACFVLTLPLA
jgi:signal transduction histidine kinase